MKITLPELSLVTLVGASGSGKSTFAKTHFKATEVLSSDRCRGWVSDDENNQAATSDAFEVLHYIAAKRLRNGLLTVVDATNVQQESRKPLVRLAREHHVLPVAIVFKLPEALCQERNVARPDRQFGSHVVRQQTSQLKRSLKSLKREGFRHVFVLDSPEQIAEVEIERQPLWNNRKDLSGPFDIIGDIHGCIDELQELLQQLGYAPDAESVYAHPEGRMALFVGDLVDRGPGSPDVVRLVKGMVEAKRALCVPGNHDIKFMRKMRGKNVTVAHGLEQSIEQFAAEEERQPGFSQAAADFMDSLVSHYVLDGGRLVIAHAGMKEDMQGRGSGKVREFALYGETTGETDEFGLPVRYNWAQDYRGDAAVVYGHTPVPEPEWLNNTINIDTGCVFGGKLTALRWPEKELVSVVARETYAQPAKPFQAEEQAPSGQQVADDLLDLADVSGKRILTTRTTHSITIREENAAAALEVMSRFAVDPRWLIYLPPTMSPCETSSRDSFLERPEEAFAYYRNAGVDRVVCQEKHMGSRAIVVVTREDEVTRKRFGLPEPGLGSIYTRTGRPFFNTSKASWQDELLQLVRGAADEAKLWDMLETDWLCLDAEIMPWSAKAGDLIRQQYAAVGAAGRAALEDYSRLLEQAMGRPELADSVSEVVAEQANRRSDLAGYTSAYQRYCWKVESVRDLKIAPFHVLAGERGVYMERDHGWHLDALDRLCAADGSKVLTPTPRLIVGTTDDQSQADAATWWEERTAAGSEGMVVKPWEFITKGRRGLLQPAIKVRGQEYLRIIYGPEYTEPKNLERLRQRGLGAKRSLAVREFALGMEALERFVRHEPLRRTHECVFGVLALESEPIDPRL